MSDLKQRAIKIHKTLLIAFGEPIWRNPLPAVELRQPVSRFFKRQFCQKLQIKRTAFFGDGTQNLLHTRAFLVGKTGYSDDFNNQ